jgi:5-methyltetrahydrofolate--homocysteine methyltransferase
MKDFLREIEKRVLIYDGSKGYMLQEVGLKGGECGEFWNITQKDEVKSVYLKYFAAGSDVIQTNTFPGNRAHLEKFSLSERTYDINYWGTKLAREAAGDDRLVAASIGPTGTLFEPYGELSFEAAYEIYKEQVQAVVDGGADIINFETFTDVAEMRAALLAAKENSNLPVICSMSFEANGHTLMGTSPSTAVHILKALGADMVGTNCSFGAEHMLGIVEEMYEAGGGYLSVKPNAGLPEVSDGNVCYQESAEDFARTAKEYVRYGARLIGGCCGTTPKYIKALKSALSSAEIKPPKNRTVKVLASGVRLVSIVSLNWNNIKMIDAGKDAELMEKLKARDFTYIEDLALDLSTEGYDAVVVDVDRAAGETDLLEKTVNMLQGYIREPLILRTNSDSSLEKALRIYKGIAGVVIGDSDYVEKTKLLKIVEKYGSEVIEIKGSP